MTNAILQSCCISLLLISFGFILLELRTKFDRIFLYFGITLVLLSLFSAIDLWKRPMISDTYWTAIQHALFCFISPFMIWYIMILRKEIRISIIKTLFFSSFILSILFLSNIMFKSTNGHIVPTIFYSIFFLPYLLVSIFLIFAQIIKKTVRISILDRNIVRFHLFGFSFLVICGLLDLIRLLFHKMFFLSIISFTILGTLGLGSLLAYVFAERLFQLIKERNQSLKQLKLAYNELEHARSLSELGKSTTIINHELRNYSFSIMCSAEMIVNAKDDNRKTHLAKRIIQSITQLNEFSKDILDFSRSKIIKEKNPVNLNKRVSRTINEHFMNKREAFVLKGFDKENIIYGDWGKLDNVFLNLFKNAFEAEASTITIKVTPSRNVILVTVEDDGIGVVDQDPKQFFKAFQTTKGKEGTGLGLSITRSIVEGHGGHISVKSKNIFSKNEQGLIFSLAFPAYTDSDTSVEWVKDNIVLIKDKIEMLPEVIQLFKNVSVNPHVINSYADFNPDYFSREAVTVFGTPNTIGKMNKRHKGYKCFSIVNDSNRGLFVVGNREEYYQGILSEEFILSNTVA